MSKRRPTNDNLERRMKAKCIAAEHRKNRVEKQGGHLGDNTIFSAWRHKPVDDCEQCGSPFISCKCNMKEKGDADPT